MSGKSVLKPQYSAGKFTVKVAQPWPAWVEISVDGAQKFDDGNDNKGKILWGLHISDLRHLKHIIDCIIDDAKGEDLG